MVLLTIVRVKDCREGAWKTLRVSCGQGMGRDILLALIVMRQRLSSYHHVDIYGQFMGNDPLDHTINEI